LSDALDAVPSIHRDAVRAAIVNAATHVMARIVGVACFYKFLHARFSKKDFIHMCVPILYDCTLYGLWYD
jgi:hypothetical protein